MRKFGFLWVMQRVVIALIIRVNFIMDLSCYSNLSAIIERVYNKRLRQRINIFFLSYIIIIKTRYQASLCRINIAITE